MPSSWHMTLSFQWPDGEVGRGITVLPIPLDRFGRWFSRVMLALACEHGAKCHPATVPLHGLCPAADSCIVFPCTIASVLPIFDMGGSSCPKTVDPPTVFQEFSEGPHIGRHAHRVEEHQRHLSRERANLVREDS